jgi:branched-chain amino acid transport system ATP-binding protein
MLGGHCRSASGFLANALRLPHVRREEHQLSQRAAEVIALLELAEVAQRPVSDLPFGTAKRVEFARALMSQPKLLLLDEPSLGLAPLVCQTIFNTIDAIRATGTTVLLVEQNANAALRHSNRGYVLETGRVILEGAAEEIARDPRVREAYLGE